MTPLEALNLVLDHVDYTSGACGLGEMVGAVLPTQVINVAREVIQKAKDAAWTQEQQLHLMVQERANQFHQMIDASEHFNSDVTSIIGRSDDGDLLFAAVFMRGEDAGDLVTFLEAKDAQ